MAKMLENGNPPRPLNPLVKLVYLDCVAVPKAVWRNAGGAEQVIFVEAQCGVVEGAAPRS
jgi:hypothetical protein